MSIDYSELERFGTKEIEVTYEDKYETKAEKILIKKANNEARAFDADYPTDMYNHDLLDNDVGKLGNFIQLLQNICDKARKTYFSFNKHLVLPIIVFKQMENKRKRLENERERLENERDTLIQEQKQGKKKVYLAFFLLQLIAR